MAWLENNPGVQYLTGCLLLCCLTRSTRDLVGFCCGIASICCWLVAQMPQVGRWVAG